MTTSTLGHAPADILGVPVAPLTTYEVLGRVNHAIVTRRRLLLGVVNAAKMVNMRRDAELGSSVLSADLILADGISVVWASRLLGAALPERVTGIDLFFGMLRLADERGYKVYCLGAKPEVLEKVEERIRTDHSGVQLAGSHHGYFGEDEEEAVAEDIRRAEPDILFVAMSSPKKERFLARWGEHMGVRVLHGVGGSFDVYAGKTRRAPAIWQRLGLEWLYRLKQEPRRLWRRYLVTNTLFCSMVLAQMVRRPVRRLRGRKAGRPRPAGRLLSRSMAPTPVKDLG